MPVEDHVDLERGIRACAGCRSERRLFRGMSASSMRCSVTPKVEELVPLTSSGTPMTPVDLLAIAAHRDDVELTCAGTLIKM